MLEAFAGLSTPLVADACVRCGVPLRAAPAGIRAVVAGQRVAGRVLPVRHYGSPAGPGRLDEREPGALATARFGAHLASSGDIVFADDDGVVFVARPSRRLDARVLLPSRTFRQHLRRTGGAIEE